MNDFTGRVRMDERTAPVGTVRTVTVALDTAQYQVGLGGGEAELASWRCVLWQAGMSQPDRLPQIVDSLIYSLTPAECRPLIHCLPCLRACGPLLSILQMDMNYMAKQGCEDLYGTFNMLMRRKVGLVGAPLCTLMEGWPACLPV